MFSQHMIDLGPKTFEVLAQPEHLTQAARGRRGGLLVHVENEEVPLLRSSSAFDSPCLFSECHYQLMQRIREVEAAALFNNAMIEMYDANYTTMGFHTDCGLDLAPGTFIALFSCYNDPDAVDNYRTLHIRNKTTNEETKLTLHHNSVVLWSVEANKQHVHSIILEAAAPSKKVAWLGLTLRCSKTFVRFDEDRVPRLIASNKVLHLASVQEKHALFRQKGAENRLVEFDYNDGIDFTVSPGDLVCPRPALPLSFNV
jgi:hypothetical protein